jgi:hypothetical protein
MCRYVHENQVCIALMITDHHRKLFPKLKTTLIEFLSHKLPVIFKLNQTIPSSTKKHVSILQSNVEQQMQCLSIDQLQT